MAVKGEGFRNTCRECQRYMRPQYAGKDEWPGTVLHGGHGYCYNCRRTMRKAGRLLPQDIPAPKPPRELDPQEAATLRLLEKLGLVELRGMLGLDDTERPQPLTDIQMMKNGLTIAGDGAYGTYGDSLDAGDSAIRRAARAGKIGGRRL